MSKKHHKNHTKANERMKSFASNRFRSNVPPSNPQFEEDVKNFVIKYLDDNVGPLVKDTTVEQRKPFWDAMVVFSQNLDVSKAQQLINVVDTVCIQLCKDQFPEGTREQLAELFDQISALTEESRDEVALYCRMRGQELLKSAFGMQSEPGSMTVMMGGAFKDKDGKWIEFGDDLGA